MTPSITMNGLGPLGLLLEVRREGFPPVGLGMRLPKEMSVLRLGFKMISR